MFILIKTLIYIVKNMQAIRFNVTVTNNSNSNTKISAAVFCVTF